MTRVDDPWTCDTAEESVSVIDNVLRQHGLIETFVFRDEAKAILTKCQSCRSGRSSSRRCRGWRLAFRGRTALRFIPVEVEGRWVQVSVEGWFNFERSAERVTTAWVEAPMRESVSTIIVENLDGSLITRQHVDLANVGQRGPVWHLQLGGLPGGGRERPEYEWLDLPRWPMQPLDFMLTVELVVFSFWWGKWNTLKLTNPWHMWVKRSEYLVLSHYYEYMKNYWNRHSSLESWLAMQCNQTGGWNPRPS